MRLPRLLTAAFTAFFLTVAAHAATEIPFRYSGGMIWVKLAVAGHREPLNFLLDSGAGASVLDLGTARSLGVKLGRSENVQGVHGRAVAYRVNDFTAHVGAVSAPSSLLALDLAGVSAGLNQRIDGLLGADFFRGRIVQIDYASGRLRLLERGEVRTAGCESLPLIRRNDALCVRVAVAGNSAEWMRIDTGCSSALEWTGTAAKAKRLSGTSIAATTSSARCIFTEVQLGSTRLTAVKAGIHDRQIFPGESGLLGNGLLSKFTVTFDSTQNRLLLAK